MADNPIQPHFFPIAPDELGLDSVVIVARIKPAEIADEHVRNRLRTLAPFGN